MTDQEAGLVMMIVSSLAWMLWAVIRLVDAVHHRQIQRHPWRENRRR